MWEVFFVLFYFVFLFFLSFLIFFFPSHPPGVGPALGLDVLGKLFVMERLLSRLHSGKNITLKKIEKKKVARYLNTGVLLNSGGGFFLAAVAVYLFFGGKNELSPRLPREVH